MCPAAGTAASEGSSSGVERDEVAGIPEPEHTGGDDAGVRILGVISLTVITHFIVYYKQRL